jgi:hypothetical protein
MDKRLAELEKDSDVGKPGAELRLTSFIAERTHLVDSIVQVSPILPFVFVRLIRQIEQCRIGELGQGGSRGPNA